MCESEAVRELLKGSHQIDGKKGGHKAEFFGLYSIKSKIRQLQHITAKINRNVLCKIAVALREEGVD